MTQPAYGIMAEFRRPEDLIEAVRAARRAGFTKLDAFSPFPLSELADELGVRTTIIPWIAFLAALVGAGLQYGSQYWMNAVDYPLNVGGRPLDSWPAFIPSALIVAILWAGVATLIGLLMILRLPRLYHPVFAVHGFRRASDLCGGGVGGALAAGWCCRGQIGNDAARAGCRLGRWRFLMRQVGGDSVVSAQRERRIGRIDPDPAVAERIEIGCDVPRLSLRNALGWHARLRLERHGIHQPGDQVARRVRQESCKEMLLGVALEARADLASGPSDALDDMTGAAAIGLNEPMPALGIAA